MRAGRVADLDAVQLGGCAGSGRYTGQRRLMTCQKITVKGIRIGEEVGDVMEADRQHNTARSAP